MGTVWRATDTSTDRAVVVKEIRLQPDLDDTERELLCRRAMREARAVARLNDHPGVVKLYDVVSDGGRPWLVMELVASRSLADVVESDGPLPMTRVAQIGAEVLAALRAAHAAGVVHRDVKPGNVLLGDDGRVVLTDFGLATVKGDPSLTQTGLIIGSPAYIAPERARSGRIGPESDLWSLGATLYLAVEGHPPYDRRRSRAILRAADVGEPEPMIRAGRLAPILAGLLRADPDLRLSTADTLRALRAIADPAPAGRLPIVKRHQPGTRRAPADGAAGLDALRGLTHAAPHGRHREPAGRIQLVAAAAAGIVLALVLFVWAVW